MTEGTSPDKGDPRQDPTESEQPDEIADMREIYVRLRSYDPITRERMLRWARGRIDDEERAASKPRPPVTRVSPNPSNRGEGM